MAQPFGSLKEYQTTKFMMSAIALGILTWTASSVDRKKPKEMVTLANSFVAELFKSHDIVEPSPDET